MLLLVLITYYIQYKCTVRLLAVGSLRWCSRTRDTLVSW